MVRTLKRVDWTEWSTSPRGTEVKSSLESVRGAGKVQVGSQVGVDNIH